MSVLVYANSSDGKFKKSAFEVVSYGKKVAEKQLQKMDPLGQIKGAQGELSEGSFLEAIPLVRDLASGHN